MAKCSFAKSYNPGIYDAYAGRGPVNTWEYGTNCTDAFSIWSPAGSGR